jgi:hypothetical protein
MVDCLVIKNHRNIYMSCLWKKLDMILIMEQTFLTPFTRPTNLNVTKIIGLWLPEMTDYDYLRWRTIITWDDGLWLPEMTDYDYLRSRTMITWDDGSFSMSTGAEVGGRSGGCGWVDTGCVPGGGGPWCRGGWVTVPGGTVCVPGGSRPANKSELCTTIKIRRNTSA